MNFSVRTILLFVAIASASIFLKEANADGSVRLFGAADIVARGDEASNLTDAEIKHLRTLRSYPSLYKNVRVVRLNRAALGANVIVIASPEGKEYQYTGVATKNDNEKIRVWKGNSSQGTLVISYDDKNLVGEFREDGHVYGIHSLADGRLQIITEAPDVSGVQELPSMSGGVDPPEFQRPVRPLPPQPSASKNTGG